MDGAERKKRAGAWRGLAAGLFLLAGCLTPGLGPGKCGAPLEGPATQVYSAWQNEVVVTADVVNHGAPLPGLAGRLYLFGADPGNPLKGKGKVTVDLFDVDQPGPDGHPKMLQRWVFDKNTLDRLLRKDLIGWGYTLFCPWPDYRPEVQRVELKVCYEPENSTPMFAPQTTVSLLPRQVGPLEPGRPALQARRPSPPRGELPEVVITGAEGEDPPRADKRR
jgi:hypothetical protein